MHSSSTLELIAERGRRNERDYCRELSGAGPKAWENLFAGERVLIILYELLPYFENAKSKAIGRSDLARVTPPAPSSRNRPPRLSRVSFVPTDDC